MLELKNTITEIKNTQCMVQEHNKGNRRKDQWNWIKIDKNYTVLWTEKETDWKRNEQSL